MWPSNKTSKLYISKKTFRTSQLSLVKLVFNTEYQRQVFGCIILFSAITSQKEKAVLFKNKKTHLFLLNPFSKPVTITAATFSCSHNDIYYYLYESDRYARTV